MSIRIPLLAAWVVLLPFHSVAQDAVTAGEVRTPHPTLENIAVEWIVSGDDDLDSTVTVRYRKEGSAQWIEALPLFRVPAGSNEGFSWENKHAGSILDLDPDTAYEIELGLHDPDGGAEQRVVSVRTRRIPAPAPDGTLVPVTPQSFAAAAAGAGPGDILVLGAGNYDGFTITVDGTGQEPVVIRAQNPGEAVVDGDVRADGRSHVHFDGLVVNGKIKFNNAVGIVVRWCRVNTPDDGIVSMAEGVEHAYIADNVVLGPTAWSNDAAGANGDNLGEGIVLTGPGNVIEHNRVAGFRDAISTMEDTGARDQQSVDILDNDIEVGADDAIEADFTMGNCRVMRNRISNSFVGLSSQPGLGGPTYFVRNVMYNIVYSPFKLHRGSVGDVALHNTVVKCGDAFAVYTGETWSRAWFRNNLFIGGEGGGTYGGYSNGTGRVAFLEAADASCSFDHDGYGSIGTGTFEGRIGAQGFQSLAEMRADTTEAHAVQVGMDVFDAQVEFPASGPFPARPVPDLRLAPGCAAVDQGTPLAGVNQDFTGAAPDLGAYEQGQELPHYGPRPRDQVPPAAPANLSVTLP